MVKHDDDDANPVRDGVKKSFGSNYSDAGLKVRAKSMAIRSK